MARRGHGSTWCLRILLAVYTWKSSFATARKLARRSFFHEYGRRVGMVPRSSLKEGKNSQMVEKRTKAPKPTKKNWRVALASLLPLRHSFVEAGSR